MQLGNAINDSLQELRAKRSELAAKPDEVWEILADGSQRAQVIARDVLAEAQDRMGIPLSRTTTTATRTQ